jgi:hypothetical protein
VAGRQVHYAQPTVTESRALVVVLARVIGTAMRDDVAHPRQTLTILRAERLRTNDSRNPAHDE